MILYYNIRESFISNYLFIITIYCIRLFINVYIYNYQLRFSIPKNDYIIIIIVYPRKQNELLE